MELIRQDYIPVSDGFICFVNLQGPESFGGQKYYIGFLEEIPEENGYSILDIVDRLTEINYNRLRHFFR